MIEAIHGVGSRMRYSPWLRRQRWLVTRIEPLWQECFQRLSARHGFATPINGDVFKLTYAYGSRYSRFDQRAYEPTFYAPFVRRITAGMTVFDVGAHVGLFTLGAAKRVGADGHVYAFEPSPPTLQTLQRHIALNGWSDRASASEAVVADVDGHVPFYIYRSSMAASLARQNVEVLNPERLEAAATCIDATSLTLDAFCRSRHVRPDVIKIDVEGAELRVLRGARDLLLQGDAAIFCEVHPRQMAHCGASVGELDAFLHDVGYETVPLDSPNQQGIFHSLMQRST